jgi:hypothetical protein
MDYKTGDFAGGLNIELVESPIEPTWTEEEEKKVRNKIDWHVVPMLTIMYLVCFVRWRNMACIQVG